MKETISSPGMMEFSLYQTDTDSRGSCEFSVEHECKVNAHYLSSDQIIILWSQTVFNPCSHAAQTPADFMPSVSCRWHEQMMQYDLTDLTERAGGQVERRGKYMTCTQVTGVCPKTKYCKSTSRKLLPRDSLVHCPSGQITNCSGVTTNT